MRAQISGTIRLTSTAVRTCWKRCMETRAVTLARPSGQTACRRIFRSKSRPCWSSADRRTSVRLRPALYLSNSMQMSYALRKDRYCRSIVAQGLHAVALRRFMAVNYKAPQKPIFWSVDFFGRLQGSSTVVDFPGAIPMTFCYRAVIILLLSSGSWGAAAAVVQEDAHDLERKVDQVFAAYDRPDSPGCALGVIRNGEFLYKRGYGSGSLELGVSLTPQSIFYMGSVSKQFTAASVVLAAEQGYLSLDDDVRKYIPELPSYGYTITLRQMLNHTSGYRDYLALLLLAGDNWEDVHSMPEILDLISRQKALNYIPGSEYLYSNTNFVLMSEVIQRTTGKSLAQFAEENIFKPLGMSHTRFYEDRTGVVPGRVPAYKPLAAGGFGVDWTTNFDLVGDGGLLSSVDDLLMWDRNFYANKLGKGTLLRELQKPGVLNSGKQIGYALGLFIGSHRGLPTVEHNGSLFGYRLELLRFPEQKFSVISLCNLESAKSRILASRVADIYLKEQERPAAAVLQVDPQPFIGQYRNPESHSVLDLSIAEGDLASAGEHFKALGPRRFRAASEE